MLMYRAVASLIAGSVVTTMTAIPARADRAAVVEARRIVEEEVGYDRAQELLVETLRRGDNGPAELVAIYELAGVAAVVLGQDDAAEQFFRRLLALHPQAALPPDTAPKIVEPFAAAQAHMAALGSLRAAARRPGGREVAVEIAADPLGMVAGVQVRFRGEDGTVGTVRGVGPAPFRAAVPGGATVLAVDVVDEYGNRLQELPAPAAAASGGGGGGGGGGDPRLDPPRRPAPLMRWTTWAIAAGATGAIGVGFAIDARRSHDRLDEILADPSMFFFGEAESARRRWKRDATIANVAFVATGLLVAGGVTVAILGRDQAGASARTTLAPWLGRDGGGLALSGAW
jgi:hypothetical protein